MVPLISYVDDDNLQYINLDTRVHDFLNHDTKEWNINSFSNILSISVVANVKAIYIPCSPIEDKILWGFS